MYTILDNILDDIDRAVVSHPPERGGALLGPRGSHVITQFLLDSDAETTAASYVPSAALTERVRAIEASADLRLLGVLHSHPGDFDQLSGPDHAAVSRGLAINPHLSEFLCPIVTKLGSDDRRENDMPVGTGKITWYSARRTRDRRVVVTSTSCEVLPLARDTSNAAQALGANTVRDLGIADFHGTMVIARELDFDGGTSITLLFPFGYPTLAPIALKTVGNSETTQLPLTWSLAHEENTRLTRALQVHVANTGSGRPFCRAWTVGTLGALTNDQLVAEAAGWNELITDMDPVVRSTEVRDAALARTRGLLPDSVTEAHICVAGCGSVGSYIAEQLVRSGCGEITLIDPDSVELPNLSRSCYNLADVGDSKVVALRRHLLNISPTVEVHTHPSTIQTIGVDGLDQIMQAADLVVGAVDDPIGQRILNRFAYARGVPGIWAGLFAGAKGGEVIMTVPDETPCYLCATGFRRTLEADAGAVSRRVDYGTGRLVGEVALGADVHHLASAAVKIALSLLMLRGPHSALRSLAETAVAAQTTYLLMGMTTDYWVFPSLFADTPGQHAFQSVWAEVTRSASCPVCGDPNGRVSPLDIPLESPTAEDFRLALRSRDESASQHDENHSVVRLKAQGRVSQPSSDNCYNGRERSCPCAAHFVRGLR